MFKDLREMISNSVFKLTVCRDEVYINNYDEILVLEDNKITLKTKDKTIDIAGENLIISRLNNQEILIKGIVKRINLGD